VNDLDAARLAAASRLDLGLDDDGAADLRRRRLRLLWGVSDDAGKHRYTVGLEKVPGLILEKIHVENPIVR
jgi:hypothetical protein